MNTAHSINKKQWTTKLANQDSNQKHPSFPSQTKFENTIVSQNDSQGLFTFNPKKIAPFLENKFLSTLKSNCPLSIDSFKNHKQNKSKIIDSTTKKLKKYFIESDSDF